MREFEHIYFNSKESLRSWLVKNHDKSPGIWMIYYKKHLNIECIVIISKIGLSLKIRTEYSLCQELSKIELFIKKILFLYIIK